MASTFPILSPNQYVVVIQALRASITNLDLPVPVCLDASCIYGYGESGIAHGHLAGGGGWLRPHACRRSASPRRRTWAHGAGRRLGRPAGAGGTGAGRPRAAAV